MVICWENIEGIKYNPTKNVFYKKTVTFVYKETCRVCKNPFLAQIVAGGLYCSNSCSSKEKNIGRIRSPETRAKIRAANIGKIGEFRGHTHTDEAKKNISKKVSGPNNYNFGKFGPEHHCYGRKHSLQTREKISKGNKGKSFSLMSRQKLSLSKKGKYCGSEASNWKGGISKLPYCYIWSSDFKEEIKGRDNYKCQNPYCLKKYDLLGVHHINYNKQDCSTENLITLCVSCNSKANFDRNWHESFYREILRRNIENRR